MGRDEFQAEFVWETAAEAVSLEACETISESECLARFKAFFDTIEARKSVLDQLRFAFSGEYSNLRELKFTVPEYGLTINQEAVESFTLSLRAGSYLAGTGNVGSIRADVDASYAYQRAGDKSETRAKVVVCATVKVSQTLSLPVSVVYANKPELLGNPDRKFGAHIGLNLKLPDSTRSWGARRDLSCR